MADGPESLSKFLSLRRSMDPLLQAPLRLASVSEPIDISVQDAKHLVDAFIEDFKQRGGSNPGTTQDAQDVMSSGGVLMSQLIQLCNGLATSI